MIQLYPKLLHNRVPDRVLFSVVLGRFCRLRLRLGLPPDSTTVASVADAHKTMIDVASVADAHKTIIDPVFQFSER